MGGLFATPPRCGESRSAILAASLEGWSQEAIVMAAVAQLEGCAHEQHAIGRTHGQRAGPRTEGFFIRFVGPRFGEILGVTRDPYRMPFKVSVG
jgi:hypothetical protein